MHPFCSHMQKTSSNSITVWTPSPGLCLPGYGQKLQVGPYKWEDITTTKVTQNKLRVTIEMGSVFHQKKSHGTKSPPLLSPHSPSLWRGCEAFAKNEAKRSIREKDTKVSMAEGTTAHPALDVFEHLLVQKTRRAEINDFNARPFRVLQQYVLQARWVNQC